MGIVPCSRTPMAGSATAVFPHHARTLTYIFLIIFPPIRVIVLVLMRRMVILAIGGNEARRQYLQ